MATIWHGDPTESLALVDASNRNCGCKFGLMGVRLTTCGVHDAMVNDQRFLDGLVFMRRNADRLLAEEFAP